MRPESLNLLFGSRQIPVKKPHWLAKIKEILWKYVAPSCGICLAKQIEIKRSSCNFFLFSLVDRSRLRPRLPLFLTELLLTEEGRCPKKLKPPESKCVDAHIFLKTDIQFTNVQNRYWQLSVWRKSQKLIKLFFSKIRTGTIYSAQQITV